MQGEIWRDIPGYEGKYQVSSLGRVKSFVNKGLILKAADKGQGYMKVSLGYGHQYYVHRLVAMAFLPNQENRPQVNHKNCNPSDNRLVNLEWVTRKENLGHASRNGRLRVGKKHHYGKLTPGQVRKIRAYAQQGVSNLALGRQFKVTATTIANIKAGKVYKHVH